MIIECFVWVVVIFLVVEGSRSFAKKISTAIAKYIKKHKK